MKKILFTVLAAVSLSIAQPAAAAGLLGIIDGPLDGMVTGALVGSVFGPDDDNRVENAAIGAGVGLLLGSSYEQSHRRYSGVSYRSAPVVRHVRHIRRPPPVEVVEVVYVPAPKRVRVVRW